MLYIRQENFASSVLVLLPPPSTRHRVRPALHPLHEFGMARIAPIALFAFVAVQIVALVAAQPNCGALSLNGNTFNLNVLQQAVQPFQTQDSSGIYEFRVCSNMQCGATPSAACQETTQPATYSLGTWDSSTTATYVNNAIVFTNQPTGSPLRGSTITVVCGAGVSYVKLGNLSFGASQMFRPSFPFAGYHQTALCAFLLYVHFSNSSWPV